MVLELEQYNLSGIHTPSLVPSTPLAGWLLGASPGLEPASCLRIHTKTLREVLSPHHREGLSFAQGHPILQGELSWPTIPPEPALLCATARLAPNNWVPNAHPGGEGGA